ncbi:TPA: hypothetical protein ACGDTF_003699, partial [Acinetobacter baumannii]
LITDFNNKNSFMIIYILLKIENIISKLHKANSQQSTVDHKLPPAPRIPEAPSKMGYHPLDFQTKACFK